MINKIKTYYRLVPWQSLRDLRTLGLLVFLVIVLLISWSGVKTIQSNFELQKQVAQYQQQNQIQQLENNNLQLQNDYYNTNQYLELSSRQELGLGSPGETELLVPKNVAMSQLSTTAKSATALAKSSSRQSKYEQNFQSWIDFIFHHQNVSN